MRVKDVMTAKVEVIEPDASVREAAVRMAALDVGALAVSHVFNLHGIVTDRDLVVRVIAERRDPDRTLVNDIMSRDSIFCFEDDDLREAAEIMGRHGLRRLAVLRREDSSLAGMISVTDIMATGDAALSAELLPKTAEAQ